MLSLGGNRSQEKAMETYEAVCAAYSRIFKALDLDVARVVADTGDIGGLSTVFFRSLVANVASI
jgi:prolyl-tRNA synthetase